MSKKILVIFYSQSGQLAEIISSLTQPLLAAGNSVEVVRVLPAKPYPFPWSGKQFFSVMPDCVLGNTTELQSFSFKESAYDLVIIGYQAWFLSASIPSNSFLSNSVVKNILVNTPVVTITGARNMWLSAMEQIKEILKNAQAKHAGNIAMVDKHPNIVSFVTILYWMFTAKKDRYLNLFPPPGVADEDIKNCRLYGAIIEKFFAAGNFDGMQEQLVNNKAVVVKYNLMFIESKAKRIFRLWANFIIKRKNKTVWLKAFKYYLIIALFIAAPILLTMDAIFVKPFSAKRIKKKKQYLSGVNQQAYNV